MARILAVDDEPAIRSLLERTLGQGRPRRALRGVRRGGARGAPRALRPRAARRDDARHGRVRAVRAHPRRSPTRPSCSSRPRPLRRTPCSAWAWAGTITCASPSARPSCARRWAAHLRRERRERVHVLAFGDVRLDLAARELYVGEARVPLDEDRVRRMRVLGPPSRPGVLARPDRRGRARLGRGKRRGHDLGAREQRPREAQGGRRGAQCRPCGGWGTNGRRELGRGPGAAARGGAGFRCGLVILRYFAYVLAGGRRAGAGHVPRVRHPRRRRARCTRRTTATRRSRRRRRASLELPSDDVGGRRRRRAVELPLGPVRDGRRLRGRRRARARAGRCCKAAAFDGLAIAYGGLGLDALRTGGAGRRLGVRARRTTTCRSSRRRGCATRCRTRRTCCWEGSPCWRCSCSWASPCARRACCRARWPRWPTPRAASRSATSTSRWGRRACARSTACWARWTRCAPRSRTRSRRNGGASRRSASRSPRSRTT